MPTPAAASAQQQPPPPPPGERLVYPALHLYPVNDTFAPKQIYLGAGPVRIGRQTNAKTVPLPQNGFFDSKVLSRMHAEVWFDDGVWIKDVKSSNGTFINGGRLSAEGVESDPWPLRTDDLVEFGIDIAGEDGKTILHHKVATRVYVVRTHADALAWRNDFARLYHGGAPNSLGQSASRGIGPTAEAAGLLRRRAPSYDRSYPSFDHLLARLQDELALSRQTGADLQQTAGTFDALHRSLDEPAGRAAAGTGQPPEQYVYQHLVPSKPSPRNDTTAHTNSHVEDQLPQALARISALESFHAQMQRSLDTRIGPHTQNHEQVPEQQQEQQREHGQEQGQETENADEDEEDALSVAGTILPDDDARPPSPLAPPAAQETASARSEQELRSLSPPASSGDDHEGPLAPPDMPPEEDLRTQLASLRETLTLLPALQREVAQLRAEVARLSARDPSANATATDQTARGAPSTSGPEPAKEKDGPTDRERQSAPVADDVHAA